MSYGALRTVRWMSETLYIIPEMYLMLFNCLDYFKAYDDLLEGKMTKLIGYYTFAHNYLRVLNFL